MKGLITTCLMLATLAGFNAGADQPIIREVNIAINDAFVPDVVDQDKDAKVVLSGMFPNSCYRWSRSEVVSPDAMNHQVKAKAFLTVNTMCLMVLVPFSKEVNLGRLPVGQHTIRFVNGDDTFFEKTLTVQ